MYSFYFFIFHVWNQSAHLQKLQCLKNQIPKWCLLQRRITDLKSNFYPMRTIDTLLEYNFTNEEKKALRDCWIANGIGGDWQNIEKTILALVESIPWYDPEKAKQLVDDIRELSIEHDMQFRMKLGFFRSNYKFSKKLYKLTHWWTWKRILVFLGALYTLCVYGKPFYNR